MTLVVTHTTVTGAAADSTALVDGPAWDANHALTGTAGLAQGGTAADLSATGGTGQVLKQASAGAAVTVGTIAFTEITGTLSATQGGTGTTSYAVGDLLYASTTTALSKLADVATGNALISGGVGVAPSWGKIGLSTHVSGTLQATNFPALTGDVTTSAGALATTLATVNSNVGTFGSSTAIPVITANAKGLVTAVTTATCREVLTANRTYYVRTDGSDSNTGLANSAGGAFLTLQKAIDATAALDIRTFSVTITGVAGTYTAGVVVSGPWVGSGTVTLTGDTTTPSNVVISTSGVCVTINSGGRLTMGGFKLVSSASLGISCAFGTLNITGAMEYGACNQGHINTSRNGFVTITASYTISGAAPYHWGSSGQINGSSLVWTITGTPAFSTAFAYATSSGAIRTFSNTSSGSATGLRYLIDTGGNINTFGGGANYFPGGTAGSGGTTAGGGFYA